MKKNLTILNMLLAFFFLAGIASCQKDTENAEFGLKGKKTTIDEKVASTPISEDLEITPYLIPGANNGGNRTCAEVASAFEVTGGFGISTTTSNYNMVDGVWVFEPALPEGFEVTIDGKYVSWSFEPPAGKCVVNIAVIVKGGNDANVYYYPDGATGDSGLSAPPTGKDGFAGLSNITFCYTLKDCYEGFACETAFAYQDGNCFSNDGFNRWGWYLGPITQNEVAVEYEIWAAAGQCDLDKGTHVGTLSLTYFDGKLEWEVEIFEGFVMSELQIYAGNAKYPAGKNGKPTVAPGQYTVVEVFDELKTEYDGIIENLSGSIYVIAHAVVCMEEE